MDLDGLAAGFVFALGEGLPDDERLDNGGTGEGEGGLPRGDWMWRLSVVREDFARLQSTHSMRSFLNYCRKNERKTGLRRIC